MPTEKQRERLFVLEPNLVLLFSAIAIPVIVLGALVILGTVRSEMNGLVGDVLLGGAAEDTARHLDSYLLNNLTAVSIMAASPTLHDAVAASNARYQGDPVAIQERLELADRDWVRSRGAVSSALDIYGAEASKHLRNVAALRPSYKEILLADRFGALVAATNITTDYYQADEEWWRRAFGDGDTGSIYFGDVALDRSVGAYALEVAVPLRDELEGTSEVTGVIKVLIGADELFSVIGSVRRGETGHALLVSGRDGTIIAGREPGDVMTRQFEAMGQLRESLQQGNRSFLGQRGDGLWLAGFAKLPQPTPAPYANWVVVVQQLHDEINAPTRRATISLVVFLVSIVLLVLAFSLYLHYKLVKPIREIDLREEMDRITAVDSSG